jgi:hypothetical protein
VENYQNNLIQKYNISEKDLYYLGCIEAKKEVAGFFEKEKLKTKSLGILNGYRVTFMDLGELINQINKEQYHLKQNLIDKYGEIDFNSVSSKFGVKYYVKIFVPIFLVFLFFGYMFSDSDKPSYCECAYATNSKKINDCYYRYYEDEIKDYIFNVFSGTGHLPDEEDFRFYRKEFFTHKCRQ